MTHILITSQFINNAIFITFSHKERQNSIKLVGICAKNRVFVIQINLVRKTKRHGYDCCLEKRNASNYY